MAAQHPPTAVMATTSIHMLFLSLFTILVVGTVTVPTQASPPTTIEFYVHENTVPGPDANRVEVATPSGVLTATEFGTISVIFDPIRETADPTSTQIGVLKGLVITEKDLSEFVTITWMLNTPSYAGTISAQGSAGLAITGGTGDFIFARGYSDAEGPLSFNPQDIVRRVILTLRYD